MRKILTLIIVLFGLTFADMIKDHAYVISAIGIKNTTGEIAYISGSTNTPNANGSYNLVPQVIIYDGNTSYVGAATPFTGCIGNDYYFDSEKKGNCFMGGTMKGATSSANGESGLVPAPAAGQQSLFLRGDGIWAAPEGKNYSNATTSASGLMSAADKTKLDDITTSADSVSFTRSLTSGTKVGTITINGTSTDMYAPTNTNTTYSAGTGISLSGTTFSNSGVRSISTGSSNGTISVNTNGSTANVAVKGLGSAAYTNSNAYASASHTHGSTLQMVQLWKNASPTSSFASQTVKLDISSYKLILIRVRTHASASFTVLEECVVLPVIYTSFEGHIQISETCVREIKLSSSGITFGAARYSAYNSAPFGSNTTVNNGYYIPTYIYGIK